MSPSAMSTLRLLSSRSVRNFTTTVAKRGEFEVHPGYSKVKQTQQHYQIDNGLNIHQRHGPMHDMLFYITAAGCIFGVLGSLQYVYKSAYPPQND